MALYPSDDLALDVSSDRMTLCGASGWRPRTSRITGCGNGAPASAERGMCRELLKHASRIHTQRPPRITNGWVEKLLHMRLPCQEPAHLHWHNVAPPTSELSRWRKFSAPLESSRHYAQPRSTQRRGNCTCSRKIKRLLACRDALLRVFFAPRPGPFPPDFADAAVGQQFLLLEIYSMQRTHLLGEEMRKYRERTLERFATAMEGGNGGGGHIEEELGGVGRDAFLRWSSGARQTLSAERDTTIDDLHTCCMTSEASVAYRRSSADRAAYLVPIWHFLSPFFLPFFRSYATAYIPISLALSQPWKITKSNTLDTDTSDHFSLLECVYTASSKDFAAAG
jgi:hypothetical protein